MDRECGAGPTGVKMACGEEKNWDCCCRYVWDVGREHKIQDGGWSTEDRRVWVWVWVWVRVWQREVAQAQGGTIGGFAEKPLES